MAAVGCGRRDEVTPPRHVRCRYFRAGTGPAAAAAAADTAAAAAAGKDPAESVKPGRRRRQPRPQGHYGRGVFAGRAASAAAAAAARGAWA
jgi:hypothetical protein